jgi:peptide/nickel transport system substrate-binding protein
MALVIQENLAEIGITVEIESYAWATLRAKLDQGDFDMSHGYWTPDYADADMFTWYWFFSENWGLPGNRAWYKNQIMDDLVTQERLEVDPERRMELFFRPAINFQCEIGSRDMSLTQCFLTCQISMIYP